MSTTLAAPSTSGALPAGALPAGGPGRLHLMATVSGVAFGLTAPLTVVYATALGAGGLLAGTAVSSMTASLLLIDLFGSRWVPRLEPRRTLAVALLIFGFGSLISALAPNLLIMILARCVQGLGAGLFQGAGPQLAVRMAGRDRAAGALGRFQAAWFLGIALGPLAGGSLLATAGGLTGLRVAFAVCALVSLAGAGVVLLLLPCMPTGRTPVLGLPRLNSMAGLRPLLALGVGGCGQAIRSGLAMTVLPLVAVRQFGLMGLALGGALSVLALSDVVSMYIGGHLADRIGRLPVLLSALLIGTAAVLATGHVHAGLTFSLLCVALGVPVGVAWVVPAAMAVDLADLPETGLAAYRIAADIGLGGGGVLAGALMAGAGTSGALSVSAVALLIPGVLALAVRETHRPTNTTIAANPLAAVLDPDVLQRPITEAMPR